MTAPTLFPDLPGGAHVPRRTPPSPEPAPVPPVPALFHPYKHLCGFCDYRLMFGDRCSPGQRWLYCHLDHGKPEEVCLETCSCPCHTPRPSR